MLSTSVLSGLEVIVGLCRTHNAKRFRCVRCFLNEQLTLHIDGLTILS